MSDQSTDILRFMAIRDFERLEPESVRLNFVRDDFYHWVESVVPVVNHVDPVAARSIYKTGIHETDLFSAESDSRVGRDVARAVARSLPKAEIVRLVEGHLRHGFAYGQGVNQVRTDPVIKEANFDQSISPSEAQFLAQLNRRSYYRDGARICMLPDDMSEIPVPLAGQLNALFLTLRTLLSQPGKLMDGENLRLPLLVDAVSRSLNSQGAAPSAIPCVFAVNEGGADRGLTGRYASQFAWAKRVYFDALYALYVLRKRESVNLDPVLNGLRTLHIAEYIALAEIFTRLIAEGASGTMAERTGRLRSVLNATYSRLSGWSPDSATSLDDLRDAGISIPGSVADIERVFSATPIVHPMFSTLAFGFEPFNSIRPIGIGDLKVVKQTFLGYRKGDIAHIETVLAGEEKIRVHRTLLKSEESSSSSSSGESESTRDNQSTDRYELKHEMEDIVKTDIAVNANLSATYNGGTVIASAAGGFSYTNARTESDKQSANYVNDILTKATSRIVTRTSQQRSQNTLRESEETNTHSFKNLSGGNISGIYLWLDKMYRAQVHNFGKRVMYEFVLPEPAAFYVQSRLHAYAASLNLPDYPETTGTTPTTPVANMPVANAAGVTEELYESTLRQAYPLSDLTPPPLNISGAALAQIVVNSSNVETEVGDVFNKQVPFLAGMAALASENFKFRLASIPAGYSLGGFRVTGTAIFAQRNEIPAELKNLIRIRIGSSMVFYHLDESQLEWEALDISADLTTPLTLFAGLTTDMIIESQTCTSHELRITPYFFRDAAGYAAWQTAVFNRIREIEERKAREAVPGTPAADPRLSAYEQVLENIKPAELNEIVAGFSSSANESIVRRELKRLCISMLTKEFDSNASDDLLTRRAATSERALPGSAGIDFPAFDIHRGTTAARTTYGYFKDKADGATGYTVPDLAESLARGPFIQFIEQAFEWEQLSRVFYGYFWADMPKWVKLMHLEDGGDPQFTEFLQAGSARVVLAIRPGYEAAVSHFMTTREPWLGGPTPVIGHPLHMPIYQEIRNQQDSMEGSEPVGKPWEFSLPTTLVYLDSPDYELVHEYEEPPPQP